MSDNHYSRGFVLDDFLAKPLDIVRFLNEHVVKQESAIQVLGTAVRNHYNRLRFQIGLDMDKYEKIPKSNILLVGPTGCGKSHMATLMSKYVGVPFAFGDATKYTEEGYVGKSVDQLILELLPQSNSIEEAELGMVYIDEIDKIARSKNIVGADISRGAVQEGLLKLIEGTKVNILPSYHPQADVGPKVDTADILFVLCGAFDGLIDQMVARRKKGKMGFGSKIQSEEQIKAAIRRGDIKATVEDFKEYGIDDQFLGRLPYVAFLEELDADDLYKIMQMPTCDARIGKEREFFADGIYLTFTNDGLSALASYATEIKIGARAIKKVMDEILLPFQTYLPSTMYSKECGKFEVTADVVNDGEGVLRAILAKYPILDDVVSNDVIEVTYTVVDNIGSSVSMYDIDDYRRIVLTFDMPDDLVEKVVNYGLENKLEPTEMPGVLESFSDALAQYESQFQEKYGPVLEFKDDAKNLLIKLALEAPHKNIADIIFSRFGQHFEFNKIYKNSDIERIFVDYKVLIDPKGFIEQLKKSNI